MSETKFGSWSVDQSPVAIEYSLVVIEEIRHEVAEGFQKLSRGGIEVGGLLYGTREGGTTRILAIRPLTCEHARGPALLLSDHDRQALAQQLEKDGEDAGLAGFECVGWFLSHTRSEIDLTEMDAEIYNTYFPAPWQVSMVIRPNRGGAMRAGFFVREGDGSVNVARSYQEFNFPDRLAGLLDHAPRPDRQAGDRQAGDRGGRDLRPPEWRNQARGAELVPLDEPYPGTAPVAASHEGLRWLPAPPPRSKWPWLVAAAVVVLGLVALGGQFFLDQAGPQPISLTLLEREGQLIVEWNPQAPPVVAAVGGALVIADGREKKNVSLSRTDLVAGKFTYERQSGDIEVRLSVRSSDGSSVQEASRFLGRPPVKVDLEEMKALEDRRAELETEIKRLQSDNTAQAERIQQLERTLRIMQTRLGVK